MTEQDLAAIEMRANAATPGPWFWNSYSAIFSAICEVTGVLAPGCRCEGDWHCTPSVAEVPPSYGDTATGKHAADAEFIAHTRTDVPLLVAEVRRLQALLRRSAVVS